jgi:hypothetical protein
VFRSNISPIFLLAMFAVTANAQVPPETDTEAGFVPVVSENRPVQLHPEAPRRGDLFVVYLHCDRAELRKLPAKVFDYDLELLRVSDQVMRGIAVVPMEIEAGSHVLRIFLPERDLDFQVEVVHRDWPISVLAVSGKFTGEPDLRTRKILDDDQRAWSRMWRDLPTRPKHVGPFVRPVLGSTTAVFGTKRTFNGQLKTRHEGLDLEGRTGVPIKALAAGRVVMSAERFVSGGTTTLDHGNGLFTSYFHMSRRRKRVGDWVQAGERIGRVGSSGRVTGPHLHLSVMVRVEMHQEDGALRSRGLYADPAPLLTFSLWGDPEYLEGPSLKR